MGSNADRFPDIVEVVVEVHRGSRNKYEFDEAAGVFRLDRVLSSAVFYNFEYGFVEGTRADDGDHTDALLIIDEPTFTGCHVWGRPVGVLEMRDEKGADYKILEDKTVEVVGWRDATRALEILRSDRVAWEREQTERR